MADDEKNPFLDILNTPETPNPGQPKETGASDNPFLNILNRPDSQPAPTSSTSGAFLRGAAQGALPGLGGFAGAEAGATLGGEAGMFAGPVGGLIGGLAGGLIGGFGGSYIAGKAQDWGISKLPDTWQDAIEKQQQSDEQQHPYASFLGGLAPFALTMTPGNLKWGDLSQNATAMERLMANPYTARLFGGAIQGGMELGNEAVSGETPDWAKIGIATGFGLVFNKPNKLGEHIAESVTQPIRNTINAGRLSRALEGEPGEGAQPRPVAPITTPGEEPPSYPGLSFGPTIAQAADLKVAGPGMTEDVFLGSHRPSDMANATAQEAARTEKSIYGPEPAMPHPQDVARRMEPELFTAYDDLSQQREQFRSWIDEYNQPSKEQFDELSARKSELEQQISETKNKDEQRRLRTELRTGVEAELSRLTERAEAYTKGVSTETPELAAARAHLMSVDQQMRDLAPQISAAHRRAADAIRSGTVEPHPILSPEQELGEQPQQAPEKTPEIQKGPKPISGKNPAPLTAEGKPVPASEPNAPLSSTDASKPEALGKPIADQRKSIAADVKRQLVAAGRPAEEAEAHAQLVAARYVARAAVFKGALGTPEELYRREAAVIKNTRPAERRAPLPKEPAKASAEALRRSADPDPDPVKAVQADLAKEPALAQPVTADPEAATESLARAEMPKVDAPMPTKAPEPIEHIETAQAKSEVEAPEHEGTSSEETAEIAQEFDDAMKRSSEGEDGVVTHVFDPPTKADVVKLDQKVKVYHAEHGWMSVEEAKAKIAEWKSHAEEQGKTRENADKVVLSLFDLTGKWSEPWEKAGYQVYRFDIQPEEEAGVPHKEMVGNVQNFSVDHFTENFGMFEGMDIHAILAACPCTDFASSGSRHFAVKDADGRTQRSVDLVHQTLATIEYFKPSVWSVENPVGRIEKLGGLPPWRSSWQPNHFGDPYTKRTLLWGRFNADMPIAPVEPVEGSKMHKKYGGKSLRTKNARSETPEGFAYAFFMANNAADHPVMALANKYDRMDRGVLEDAVKAGMKPEDVSHIVDDHYYLEMDDAGANKALREAIDKAPEPEPAGPTDVAPQAEPEVAKSNLENATPTAAEPAAKKPRAPKPAKEAPDVRLKDFKDQETHGYTEGDDPKVGAPKEEFLKDGQRYLKSVDKALTDSGWTAHVDRKGKGMKSVYANPAGPAVAGDVSLSLHNPETNTSVFVTIGHGTFKNDTHLMMRVAPGKDSGAAGGQNIWLDNKITAKDLVAKIEQAAESDVRRRSRIPPKPEAEPTAPVDETPAPTNAEGEPAPVGEANDDGNGERLPGGDDETVLGGAPEVPVGEQPLAPQELTEIRGTPEISASDRGTGSGNAPAPDGAADQSSGRASERVSGPDQVVTKPPTVSRGDGEGQPDTPAQAGVTKAARQIIERTRSNYRITDEDAIGQGTPKEKITANVEAIRTLKAIEEEGREATPEEKAKLVKYTGWGAFAQDIFSPYKETYKREREALRSLMTDPEYEAARASTLNAHYTSPDVIKGMWDAITNMGYEGGLAMEPSAGAGHFLGLTPDSVAPKTAWTAVELDPITGRIAKSLYGGAEVNVQGFETLKRPSNYYDLIISNVPFGDYNLREKPYGAFPIHDFFFVKSLDKVRPGGVVAFVTSRYTMDKLDPSTRKLLAKSADLVGAVRLPGGNKGAFAGNAGTSVTTDIMFLRKRVPGEDFAGGAKWTDTKEIQTPEGATKINEYFADNPHMMLGEMRLTRGMYSDGEPTLVGEAEGLREKIAEAAKNFAEGSYTERGTPATAERTNKTVHANDMDSRIKEGSFFTKDGKLFKKIGGQGVEHQLSGPDTDRVTRLSGIRDIVNDLLRTQLSGGEGASKSAEALREELRNSYDDFVKKHGPINKEVKTVTSRLNKAGEPVTLVKRPNIKEFLDDPDGYKVAAIENYDPETGKAERAGIQLKDVISPPVERKINSPADALAATLDAKGGIDLQHLGRLMGAGSEEEVVGRLGDLIYQNPNGHAWEPADKYLSGDVVGKLEEARELAKSDPSYMRNVAALEKVQPTPLTPQDITVQFGAPWVPPEHYVSFLKDIGGSGVKVSLVPIVKTWRVEANSWSRDATSKFGTDRVKVTDIVDAAMHNRQITVYDRDQDGNAHVNQAETEKARIKAASLKEAFTGDPEAGIDGWVWQDPDRSAEIAGMYNRTFNNLASRQYDGSHQTFPGMSAELTLRKHQSDAVWRIVQSGNTLLGHVVGAGKTFTMIAAGMEQRRLGLINKPMYVVPNHMLEQFSREFLQAYPDAKILVAQKDEMTKDTRRAFISKVAANDWDGIVITHDAFGRVNMAQDYRQNFIRDQLDELERVRQAEAAESGSKSPTVKELEKAKKRLEGKLDKLMNEDRKDEGVTFEESGVDHIILDEAHLFKNLSFVTRLNRVKGLSQGDSQRAEDLFLKMRYLEQKRPGRSGVFATGTPVSNTMAEIWTMQRYLQLDRLREQGLDTFDAWASTFGKITNNMELSADGRTYKEVSSFSKFVNVPELISLYSEIADTKTADMLNLPRPELKTRSGAPGIEIVEAEPSAQEEEHIEKLVRLAESLKGARPEPGKPNMLSVVTEGRKVATDGRLIDPDGFDFNPQGKIAKAVEHISRIYKEGEDSKTGKAQMVFLDMGVPSNGKSSAKSAVRGPEIEDEASPLDAPSRMNLYADLKERLVAEGIPPSEIAFIHDASDDAKKAALFAKVRSGEVRVIVGSSAKMGVGTNVQRLLVAMHHLDAPWKPAEVEQRDGRILRQGNLNPEIQIYRYITKRSFDAFMWQKLDTKSKFIAQVLSGAKGSRYAEDIDSPLPEAAEMKAAASGDPRIMEHAELERQVRQLSSQKRVFDQTTSRATWELGSAKSRVEQYEATIGSAKIDAGNVQDLAGEKFSADLGSGPVNERKAAGETIRDQVLALDARQPFYATKVINVGKLSGFDMALEVKRTYSGDSTYVQAFPTLVGEQKYSATQPLILNPQSDPVGIMRRFEAILQNISGQPDRLAAAIANERKGIEKLEQTVVAKWPREQELKERQQKLMDLTQALKAKDEAKPEELPQPTLKTDTPQFKKWFGNSKAVDESGKPKVMYHGSTVWEQEGKQLGDIHQFDRMASVNIVGREQWLDTIGSWFSDKPEGAEKYSGSKGTIYPVYLSIKNPYESSFTALLQKARELGPAPAKGNFYGEAYEKLRNSLIEQGYDGVVIKHYPEDGAEFADHTAWVAFEPTQIKSAIANNGDFDPTNPRILNQTANGKIRLAEGRRPVITLMETADASTFLHESGHEWLEQLVRDSAHPMAPDQLKTDMQTVRGYLGMKDGQASPTTGQHEKFARSFEQYLMEGVAPSKELAGVFAKFKNWLVSIYQTVKGLGAPINDDIRKVFDRMLSVEPERTVISPEREPGGATMGTVHETDAKMTEAHEAEPAAQRVDAERMKAASEPPEDIANELIEAARSMQRENIDTPPEVTPPKDIEQMSLEEMAAELEQYGEKVPDFAKEEKEFSNFESALKTAADCLGGAGGSSQGSDKVDFVRDPETGKIVGATSDSAKVEFIRHPETGRIIGAQLK